MNNTTSRISELTYFLLRQSSISNQSKIFEDWRLISFFTNLKPSFLILRFLLIAVISPISKLLSWAQITYRINENDLIGDVLTDAAAINGNTKISGVYCGKNLESYTYIYIYKFFGIPSMALQHLNEGRGANYLEHFAYTHSLLTVNA
jgi:uncharacterized membrane protein